MLRLERSPHSAKRRTRRDNRAIAPQTAAVLYVQAPSCRRPRGLAVSRTSLARSSPARGTSWTFSVDCPVSGTSLHQRP